MTGAVAASDAVAASGAVATGEAGPATDVVAARWRDACLAARLVAAAPAELGGIWLRSSAGPVRDLWLRHLAAALPAGAPRVRAPLHADDDSLLGGLDLAATLAASRPVSRSGILARAHGGILLLPGAERVSRGVAGRLATVLDTGETATERDGFSDRTEARFAAIALDEGIEAGERPPPALTDRLAIHLDLTGIGFRDAVSDASLGPTAAPTPARVPDDLVAALAAAALAFGIGSLRAEILAVRLAAVAAAHAGRREATREDAELAARLVLAPRATRLPSPPASEDEAPEQAPPDRPDPPDEPDAESAPSGEELADLVLAAVAAAIPPRLLDALRDGAAVRPAGGGGAGAERRDPLRGRPVGTERGAPGRGARLDLVATLRAAAPWQTIRRSADRQRIAIRRDDIRIRRFRRRVETTALFVVDASGSAAFHRLAEAKGAVELLLAQAYVRRDRVALVAFRGAGVELVLPPTRSLARAKRALAALPGGGGTPLAAAIEAAGRLAATTCHGGGSAIAVFLTDGRANLARDGSPGRERAAADAAQVARDLRAQNIPALVIDISPRPASEAETLAAHLGARYLPLPRAGAAGISDAVGREMAVMRQQSGR